MQQNLYNPEQRFCYKCHHPADISDVVCRRCGCRMLRTKKTIRVLGGVLVFLGGFISAMMAVVMVFMLGVFAKADAAKFRGEEDKMLFAVGIVGLTFAVGVAFSIAGVLQIIFGRRNTIVVWISLGLVAVLLIAGKIFTTFY
jgi:ribosomal protein L40E